MGWLNLTPNTPVKITKIIMMNFQKHNLFLLMKRADKREKKTRNPGR
jgi:hypothetical protein